MSYVRGYFITEDSEIEKYMCGEPTIYITKDEKKLYFYRVLNKTSDALYEAIVQPMVEPNVCVTVIGKTRYFKLEMCKMDVPVHCIDTAINIMLRRMYERVVGKMSSPSTKALPRRDSLVPEYVLRDLKRY